MKDFLEKLFTGVQKSYAPQTTSGGVNPWFGGGGSLYNNWIYICIDKIVDVISKTEIKGR
jgi:hypothetical protein